ncbi:flagellar basal body P-ring formation chaperone FlgA [Modicisalibacter tunisiensis]|uniref:Flagella basal body P-ring formation protein FlgA n=1 Tax=Modicisalibacter tunisiensis TaxID=390637 RepID=A0ABS7X131_9GAMM|nr:flagellar basal body P-ring formation chaperone FlgA [Modicisalibacter tunisiensis]MBZ9568260.1 flagellar basal body P-ring formation protein FlgA [Modicisalibacter tunisiensis]
MRQPTRQRQARRRPWQPIIVALAFGLLFSGGAGATNDVLSQRVTQLLTRQAGEIGEVAGVKVHTPSAVFAHCDDPQPFLPDNGQRHYGRVSVGVHCEGPGGRRQTRYLQADVSVRVHYVTVTHDLTRGSVITRDDLRLAEGRLEKLPRDIIRDPVAIIGQVATSRLQADRPLRAYQLHPRDLVKRGQRVTVIARGPGFEVSREAEALDNGAMGEQVRVRAGDRKILRGRVIGPRRLAIDL